MSRNPQQGEEMLLATLGTEPQVITLCLDRLLGQQKNIVKTLVVYTEEPRVKEALKILEEEFPRSYPEIDFQAVGVEKEGRFLEDFRTPEDVLLLWQTFYRLIREAKEKSYIVHLNVAGGRKVMGVMAIAAAQLLFGPQDQVWYLLTEGWQPGSPRRLHLPPEAPVSLFSVPVLWWKEGGCFIEMVATLKDPQETKRWFERIVERREKRRQREFVKYWLTPAERKVLKLACLGLDNAQIAETLRRSKQTIANQFTKIYEKFKDWQNNPEEPVNRTRLVLAFASYFQEQEEV